MEQNWRVDFHCHTLDSRDSWSGIDSLYKDAIKKGIDRVVITDHNRIQLAREASKLYPELFIVGEEIKTTKGELLGVFITAEIREGLEPLSAIKEMRKQGAFICVSHPFDIHRNGWKNDDLLEILPFIDAIEIFNSRCLDINYNEQAKQFAAEKNVLGIAGSDSHLVWELGRAVTILPPFYNAQELHIALCNSKVEGKRSPLWVHLGSTTAKLKQTRH